MVGINMADLTHPAKRKFLYVSFSPQVHRSPIEI